MDDSIAIRAESVGKMYRIKLGGTSRYNTLRESLAAKASDLWKSKKTLTSSDTNEKSEFWSLRDVSFEVRRGEVLGIIGRNGAGKSTLLKILSRITPPTTGRVEITGRVASLLEVGTGFHPELTGRENIFLNGSILGMKRVEIARAFDEMVEFSDIGDFIDIPVKRYSSGMYVRLAFSVAAHLDPDILILDEVLAVGDAKFQKKCVAKVNEIARSKNRTIILVSHGMGAITSMCDRAILLEEGKIVDSGPASAVVDRYFAFNGAATTEADFSKPERVVGDELATLLHASVENGAGDNVGNIDIRDSFQIKMTYRLNVNAQDAPVANCHFRNSLGQVAFVSGGKGNAANVEGVYEAICCVPAHLMNSDTYTVDIALTYMQPTVHVSFYEKNALTFNVVEPSDVVVPERNGYTGPIPGVVRPKLAWRFNRCGE
jgi:lipopolysaccharide transport system ATP-binding protein